MAGGIEHLRQVLVGKVRIFVMHFVIVDVAPQPLQPRVSDDDPAAYLLTL